MKVQFRGSGQDVRECRRSFRTASKTLAPALRLAWLLVPRDLVDETAAQHAHRDCAVNAPTEPALLLGYGQIAEAAIPRAVEQLAGAAWPHP